VTDHQYDAIVIGGGHNGLVNAAYLAKAGLNTVVLEKNSVVGGAAITEELYPGFQFTTFSYALSLVRPQIVADLDLVKHGMVVIPMLTSFNPMENGDYLLIGPDRYQNYHEIARHSRRDAEAYFDYSHILDRVCQATKPLFDQIPPDPSSDDPAEIERIENVNEYIGDLDREVRIMLLRFLRGSAADILDDYFETDIVKAYLASSGIIGTKVGPRSEGSGLVLLFHNLGETDGNFGDWGFHKQGNGGFTQALGRAAQALGVTIELETGVTEVITENGRAVGVAVDDGREWRANTVVSALDPGRTFLDLVGRDKLPTDLVDHIERFKFQGVSSKVNFALDGLPEYPARAGRSDHYRGFINVGPSLDYVEAAFADALEGRFSSRPFLDCSIQTQLDPDMAPPGKHVLSSFVQYTPYGLAEGDWTTERENLGDTVQATLESFFPGFGDLVLHREVVTPLDIETVTGLSEGNIFAGEFLLDQMYTRRPAPGWNQYRTPIAGYYQCGSGTHPGGCVSGGPGMLAARQILGDLDL
jgi:phytoene dehydrogenase-like protein